MKIRTHKEIARRCGYVTDDQAQVLDQHYEHLLGQLVTMANRPEVWTAGKAGSVIVRPCDKATAHKVSQSQCPNVASTLSPAAAAVSKSQSHTGPQS